MKKLIIKLKIVWYIMTNKYNHFVILNVNDNNLRELLKGNEEFDVEFMYVGVQPYVLYKMIKRVGNTKSDIDMVLDKAQFEADAEIKYRGK